MHTLIFAVKFFAIWFVVAAVVGLGIGHFIYVGRQAGTSYHA